uniref:DUF4283 domain-containing protein n=1 Tax=Cannabis sativa TaxID=3483 RepID=A0A803Q8T4_CANSA
MQNTLASLWQPGKGMFVKELEPNLYVFQFYHEIDIQRVIEGSPWTFNRFKLIFERLKAEEDPRSVRLDMWVQLHNLRMGFMTETNARNVGNYTGSFVKSDPKNFMGIWRDYLHIRFTVNIEQPLKIRIKLKRTNGKWLWCQFKYEFVSIFCFICGIIGHSEKFSHKLFEVPLKQIEKLYGLWMMAEPRRRKKKIGAQWLHTETETDKHFLDEFESSGLFAIKGIGRSGGIALLWKIQADVHVMGFSSNYIDVSILNDENGVWRLTGCYGEPNGSNRIKTWTLLRNLAEQYDLPWYIIGDLNNVASHDDKKGGNSYPEWLIEGFNRTLTDCILCDIELTGYPFKWEKGKGTNNWIEVRLDRALAN